MRLHFRLAESTDLEGVVSMFNDAIYTMKNNGIDQWDEIYPNKDVLKEDIIKKQLYIATYEESIAAAYVLNDECDEQYSNGKWNYPQATYSIIHRLCINPKFQNKGIGTLTMLHIEDRVKKMNIESIRLDAFTLNPYALKMYKKLGYCEVGFAQWRKGKFYLMEKRL